jgi:hypothetical protein
MPVTDCKAFPAYSMVLQDFVTFSCFSCNLASTDWRS